MFLVVDVRKGKLYWSWIDSIKTELVGAAVNGLKEQTEIESVVWDGTRNHRDRRVAGLGMGLIRLPPYSPELNPVGRVFEEIRRWIERKLYKNIEEKVVAVAAFLTELETELKRVRSLTDWDWIEDAVQQLPSQYTASSQRFGIRL